MLGEILQRGAHVSALLSFMSSTIDSSTFYG